MKIPEKPRVKFSKGYKYQLRGVFVIQTKIFPEKNIYTDLVWLTTDGVLTILRYFAWDGCSGPTIDDQYNAVPGLVHDALAYLMRIGGLDPDIYFNPVNAELDRLMLLYRSRKTGFISWLGKKRANLYRWVTDHSSGKWARKPKKIYIYPKEESR